MSQQIDQLLALLRLHSERLNKIDTPSPTATPFYELMSGGLVWTDEKITGVPTEVIWALRPLFAHRASLIKGVTDSKWQGYWVACIEMFPRWIGFLPERAKPTAQHITLLKRGEEDMLRDLDSAMNADGSAEPSKFAHPDSSFVYPVGYSAEWEALGIITRQDMERDREACEHGDDPHPEHYRWRAFVRFVHGQPSLAAETARRLYALGGVDQDVVLGESIMSAVLRHDDCPDDLFKLGLETSSEHLRQVAKARIGGKTN